MNTAVEKLVLSASGCGRGPPQPLELGDENAPGLDDVVGMRIRVFPLHLGDDGAGNRLAAGVGPARTAAENRHGEFP